MHILTLNIASMDHEGKYIPIQPLIDSIEVMFRDKNTMVSIVQEYNNKQVLATVVSPDISLKDEER